MRISSLWGKRRGIKKRSKDVPSLDPRDDSWTQYSIIMELDEPRYLSLMLVSVDQETTEHLLSQSSPVAPLASGKKYRIEVLVRSLPSETQPSHPLWGPRSRSRPSELDHQRNLPCTQV
jgi:hypothetical protein